MGLKMYLWREFSSRDVGLAARGYCRGPQQGDLPPLDLPRCGPCITIEFARQQHEQHHSARKHNEDDMCLRTVGFSSFGSTHRILRACKLSGHTMWGICILTHTHTLTHVYACMYAGSKMSPHLASPSEFLPRRSGARCAASTRLAEGFL